MEVTSEPGWVAMLPDGYAEDESYPLLVGLHSYGNTPLEFGRRWSEGINQPGCIHLFPRAPFEMTGENGGTGYAWSLEFEGEGLKRDIPSTLKKINDIISTVIERYPVDEKHVYLYGFSQGGLFVYLMAQNHPERFAGFAVFGGAWEEELLDASELTRKANVPWLISHQSGDPVVDIDKHFHPVKNAFIENKFYKVQWCSYLGDKHQPIPEQFQDFHDWLSRNVHADEAPETGDLLAGINEEIFKDEPEEARLLELLDQLNISAMDDDDPDIHEKLYFLITTGYFTDSVVSKAIYTAGSLRVEGLEDMMTLGYTDPDKPAEHRERFREALLKIDTPEARDGLMQGGNVADM